MSWDGKRRATLPSDWRKIRARILRRDPLCRIADPHLCTGRSTEVDHIGAPDNHHPDNLRGVCTPCHKARTQAQAQAARKPQARPKPPHPGVI